MRYIFFIIGSLAWAQSNKQMTPLIVLPPASHTGGVGGEIRIQDVSGTVYSDIAQGIFGLTLQAANLAAGDIILTPGNVGPASSVVVLPPRLDVPSLIVQDAAGSPSSQSFVLRNSSAVPYFTVAMGTGIMTDLSLAGAGTQCLQANNSGVVSGSGSGCGGGGASWSSYTPTVGNLASPAFDAAWTQHGKDIFFRVAAAGTSNGSVPTVTLPITPFSVNMAFAVEICTGGACVPGTVSISGSTMFFHIYNNTAFASTVIYSVVAQGVYDTP